MGNVIKYSFVLIIVVGIMALYFSLPASILNKQACINSICFNIEIADTPEERQRGLMDRNFLEENKGMLFIFQEERIYSFWMKNTLIPLDIIWINKEKEIVYIEHSAQPCVEDSCVSYNPNTLAFYVLEINAGLSKKYNFQIGNKISIVI